MVKFGKKVFKNFLLGFAFFYAKIFKKLLKLFLQKKIWLVQLTRGFHTGPVMPASVDGDCLARNMALLEACKNGGLTGVHRANVGLRSSCCIA